MAFICASFAAVLPFYCVVYLYEPTSYRTLLWILIRMVFAIGLTVTEKAWMYAFAIVTLELMITAWNSVQFMEFICGKSEKCKVTKNKITMSIEFKTTYEWIVTTKIAAATTQRQRQENRLQKPPEKKIDAKAEVEEVRGKKWAEHKWIVYYI